MPDHVHMMISIPPKYAVSQVIGYFKGNSAIHLARVYGERRRTQFCRATFLGAIFCLDRRERRNCDPGIHQEPGKGRSEAGVTKPLALIGHHEVAQ
jgi:transposase IS200 family protein